MSEPLQYTINTAMNFLYSFKRRFERDNIFERRFERPMGAGTNVAITDKEYESLCRFLELAKERGEMPGEWVSVDDHLPAPYTKVQVFCVAPYDATKTQQWVAWLDREIWWDTPQSVLAFTNFGKNALWYVTHWSPLADDPQIK